MTEQKKKELLRILDQAEHYAQSLMSKGRQMVEQGQFISDLDHLTKEFIKIIPDDSCLSAQRWEDQLFTWQNINKQLTTTQDNIVLTDSSSLTAVVSGGSIISTETISNLPSNVRESAQVLFFNFEKFTEQSNLFEKIQTEINRLNLVTASTGKESAITLLQQAKQAFNAPSVDEVVASSVLIPLREAINIIVTDLLPRRPTQEKTGGHKEKIQSICRQCSRDGIESKQISILANEAHDLNDLLSGSKQSKFTRDYVRELLNRGLAFLLSLLEMLDEHKMK